MSGLLGSGESASREILESSEDATLADDSIVIVTADVATRVTVPTAITDRDGGSPGDAPSGTAAGRTLESISHEIVRQVLKNTTVPSPLKIVSDYVRKQRHLCLPGGGGPRSLSRPLRFPPPVVCFNESNKELHKESAIRSRARQERIAR